MSMKLPYEYIKKQVENLGYELISTEYVNNYSKLKIRCTHGHVINTTYSNFQQGWKCRICRDDKQRNTYNYVKTFVENKGYKLLSTTYLNNKTKLEVKCKNGHIFYPRFDNFQHKTECPCCKNMKSKPEKEISKYIKSIYNGAMVENDRTVIQNPKTGKNLELDIYLPELNKAIEYNGIYWHGKNFPSTINRDLIKNSLCMEKSVKLFVIKENDWINKKINCLNEIKNFILGEI